MGYLVCVEINKPFQRMMCRDLGRFGLLLLGVKGWSSASLPSDAIVLFLCREFKEAGQGVLVQLYKMINL